MERREYLKRIVQYGGCIGCLPLMSFHPDESSVQAQSDDFLKLKGEKEFIQNWLTDLMDTIDKELDESAKQKLMAGCGKGCFDRHKFKQDIAAQGKGNIDRLIEAYSKNFEIWKDGKAIHIRYGETSKGCYCPAARYRPAKSNDLHCECTRNTHKTIFETALGKPVNIIILETVRRGGKTCHFMVEV